MTFPLNLPIAHLLAESETVLIAGAGGGFDVFTGLPIYHQLRAMGKTVHLANYSFVDFEQVQYIEDAEMLVPGVLLGTRGRMYADVAYYPEGYLARWFDRMQAAPLIVWVINKVGVPGVRQAYAALVDRLNLDAIILCDGGVDSLMRGDETGKGTFLEDTISVAAVAGLADVPVKLLAAIGMGTEIEEQVSHYAFLENVAALARTNAYYGSCALIPQMSAFQFYQQAARYVFEHGKHEASRIQTRLIPAVWGKFGDYNWYDHPRQPEVFLTPLTALYWFFDLEAVSARSYVTDLIEDKPTFAAAFRAVSAWARSQPTPPRQRLPLL
jgi:hypothetical protein